MPVYEIGLCQDERPFIAMKLVKGETLAALLERRRNVHDDRHKLLTIFEQVCQTVAYAHVRRVVHRDLKPSNVMVGAFGEVQIVDWGFAKVLRAGGVDDEAKSLKLHSQKEKKKETQKAKDPSHIETLRSSRERQGKDVGSESQIGSAIGTPAYMPPEQARGEVEEMDQRSDVFALGAILTEILTGKPPYVKVTEDSDELLVQAAQCQLDDARRRLDSCDSDIELVELCRQCLSISRHARPQDAAAVAKQFEEYLTGIEKRARRAEVGAAAARVRAKWSYALAASVLVTVLVAGGSWLWIQDERAVHVEEQQKSFFADLADAADWRQKADKATGGARVGYYEKAVSLAKRAAETGSKGVVSAELVARTAEFIRDLEAKGAKARIAHREERLLAELIELRVPKDEDMGEAGWLAERLCALDAGYRRIFMEYDVDIDTLPPTEAAHKLKGARSTEIAAALDHWAMVRRDLPRQVAQGRGPAPADTDVGGWRHVQRVARALDPDDSWRNDLRDCLASADRPDKKTVGELAARADFKKLPAVSVTLLASALLLVGDRDAALAVLRDGQRHHPQDFHLAFTLGMALERAGRWQDATQYYTAALSIRPDMAVLALRLGFVTLKIGNRNEALKWYDRAIQLNPKLAEAWAHKGVELVRMGHSKEALFYTLKGVEIAPQKAITHWAHGNVLEKQGDLDRSIKHLREATKLRRNFTKAEMGLGKAYQRKGQNQEAAQVFRVITRRDKDNPEAQQLLGVTLHMSGDPRGAEAAIASLRAIVKMMATDNPEKALLFANQMYATEGFASAYQAYEITFAADANLCTGGDCYRAACAAVMAAAGMGKVPGFVPEERRPPLRQRALTWLEQELARKPEPKQLKSWQQDLCLAPVREAQALKGLPPAEAAKWQAFWQQVRSRVHSYRSGDSRR
ncbi:MAG: protein kinase domain-containing protein [Planctomycetota bacterium]